MLKVTYGMKPPITRRIGFIAHRDNTVHRGIVVTAEPFIQVLGELEKDYDVVIITEVKLKMLPDERVTIYDLDTNERIV